MSRPPSPRLSVKNQAKRLAGWQQHQQLDNDEIVAAPVATVVAVHLTYVVVVVVLRRLSLVSRN